MNTSDVLKYGHLWVLKHVEGLSDEHWETPNVCGWWSVKNIIAHLASFEQVLVDVLNQCLEGGPTPVLDQFIRMDGDSFNANQVDMRKLLTPRQGLEDYAKAHSEVMTLLKKLPPGYLRQVGSLPWYGAEYDLEDYIVYSFYGHKREHCAQIAIFRDSLNR